MDDLSDGYEPPNYPALKLLMRFGRLIAGVLAVLLAGAGLAAVVAGYPVWVGVAALVAAPLLLLLMFCLVEMAEIVAATLMPR